MPTATGDAEVDREPPDHGPSADPNEPAADGGGPRRLLREAGYAARFLWTLPRYLRRPLTPAEARAEIRRMLRARESGFLDLARRVIYARPAHPVRRLLVAAGCEYGDLVRLVESDGLEGTLSQLLRQGVYLTIDEFKRGRPVVRGGTRFVVDPRDLLNPLNGRHLPTASGGSRGIRTPASADLWQERLYAVGRCLFLEASGVTEPRFAVWDAPGSASLQILLLYAAAGARPARWFSQIDLSARGLGHRYRWSGRLLRWGSALAGVPMPRPETVPLADPTPIVEWLQATLRVREHPILRVSSSAAVRVAEAARSSGVSLAGARFVLGSEPVTPSRLAAIRRAGVSTSSVYGSMDAGLIGEPCAVDTLAGFDRDYFLYQEDADLCLRARRAGYRIGYADESVVHHLHRQSQPELSEYEYARRVFGGSAVFWEKHYPPRDVLRIVRFQYWISRLLLGLEPARRWTPQWPSVLSAPRLRARRDVCLEWLNRNGHGRVGLTGFPGKIALRHCHVVVEWLRQRRFPLDDY